MPFCNAFDQHLAAHGPAAIFLPDHEGMYRLDPSWSRDAWERAPGPHVIAPRWALLRDHATSFVQLVLVTSPTLLATHPRADVRLYDTEASAVTARACFGSTPVCSEPWAGESGS